MTADEAKREVNKAFEPAFANYIIEALTNGATCSDKRESSTYTVSREDVKNFIESFIHEIITESGTDKNAHTNEVLREVARGVGDIPPVTPERPKGEWKYTGGFDTEGNLKCSCCDNEVDVAEKFNFCPNCGADMRVGE